MANVDCTENFCTPTRRQRRDYTPSPRTPVCRHIRSGPQHGLGEGVTPVRRQYSNRLSGSWGRHTLPPTPHSEAKSPAPALWQALRSNSADFVLETLTADPWAAAAPFIHQRFDPPLCCAVRIGCDVVILKALLRHRADPNAIDAAGHTPLSLIASGRRLAGSLCRRPAGVACCQRGPYAAPRAVDRRHAFAATLALLAGGASSCSDGNGCLPADLATASGDGDVALLLRHYHDAQACAVLRRSWRNRTGVLQQLPLDVLDTICGALAPAEGLRQLRLQEAESQV